MKDARQQHVSARDERHRNIERFKSFIDPWSEGFKLATLSYVALKQTENKIPVIVAAAVRLWPVLDQTKLHFFTCETPSLIAGFTHWNIDSQPLGFLSRIDEWLISPPNSDLLRICDKGLTSHFDTGTSTLKTNQPRSATLKLTAFGLNSLLQDPVQLV